MMVQYVLSKHLGPIRVKFLKGPDHPTVVNFFQEEQTMAVLIPNNLGIINQGNDVYYFPICHPKVITIFMDAIIKPSPKC